MSTFRRQRVLVQIEKDESSSISNKYSSQKGSNDENLTEKPSNWKLRGLTVFEKNN